jgi:hypothetical protein
MRRLFITVIAFLAISQVSFARDKVFSKNDMVVSAGLGFVNSIHSGNGWKASFPPISLAGEYGIVDNLIDGNASIGIGLNLGYAGMKYKFTSNSYKFSDLILGARGAFHYQFVSTLDTYAGLMLGYDIVSGNRTYASSEFVWGIYIGARYYFNSKFAITAEIGKNVSLFNIGVAYKF